MRATSIATALLFLSLSPIGIAQQETCGLRKMTETTTPIYPPIAKAAHVEGNVVMLVNFKTSGEVEKIDIVSGHEMLKIAATNYVQGWHANEYTGPRTCPIVVSFRLHRQGDTTTPPVVRQDLQHVTLTEPAALVQASLASDNRDAENNQTPLPSVRFKLDPADVLRDTPRFRYSYL